MGEISFSVDVDLHQRLSDRYREVDGLTLRLLIGASLDWLRTNQQVVNSLNVFPVPDGDTGTNMVLTMQSAMDEIAASNVTSISKVAHAIAHGALMGARGNSGVILSQLWRGFARSLDEAETMNATSLTAALAEARDTAYKGVVKPVEGTILTVSKDVASAAENALNNGAESTLEILESVVRAADESVEYTPELLPVLKEAGVVDSGGKGLFFILEGILRAVYRQPLDQPEIFVKPLSELNLESANEAIEPGQDWEVVVDFKPNDTLDLNTFYQRLEELGTSIQVGEGDGVYRMHIHVPDKTEYEPIETVKNFGTITNVAIENLMIQTASTASRVQISDLELEPIGPDEIGVVVVAPGLGIARVFASLGVAAIIEGGQSMNPSTQEILAAVEELPTSEIIILPNNQNILLATRQAVEMTKKQVVVVPSTSIPQGITAIFSLDQASDLEKNAQVMEESLTEIQSAEITTATRSVEIDGVKVQDGQVIGLLNGKLACSGDSLEQVMHETLTHAQAENGELITFYYGADLPADLANELAGKIKSNWPDQEVEVIDGGQPHYQAILSIE